MSMVERKLSPLANAEGEVQKRIWSGPQRVLRDTWPGCYGRISGKTAVGVLNLVVAVPISAHSQTGQLATVFVKLGSSEKGYSVKCSALLSS